MRRVPWAVARSAQGAPVLVGSDVVMSRGHPLAIGWVS